MPVTAWVVHLDTPADERPDHTLRVAVKDAIDIAGVVTTAGCAAVRNRGVAAAADAACLAGTRAAEAHIVGKTNLTELCLDPIGIDHAFSAPLNPIAPNRVPGGSSSGNAVALASGEVDIAFGTDTGGSVRIPAACCGIVGLKPTWGRVPTAGVWQLAPSLDTVGPMARNVTDVAAGMRLLAPGWSAAHTPPARVVGRLRVRGTQTEIEDAVDAALTAAELTVRPVDLPDWDEHLEPFHLIVLAEFWQTQGHLLDAAGVGKYATAALRWGSGIDAAQLREARAAGQAWHDAVVQTLASVDLLTLPTLIAPPPLVAAADGFPATWLTAPFNLSGLPALAMPAAGPFSRPGSALPASPVPPSLQLVAPPNREDLLCATGAVIEAALGGTNG